MNRRLTTWTAALALAVSGVAAAQEQPGERAGGADQQGERKEQPVRLGMGPHQRPEVYHHRKPAAGSSVFALILVKSWRRDALRADAEGRCALIVRNACARRSFCAVLARSDADGPNVFGHSRLA